MPNAGAKLGLFDIDADYEPTKNFDDHKNIVYDGELKLLPSKLPTNLRNTMLYSCGSNDLLLWLEDETRVGSVKFIDVRSQADIDQILQETLCEQYHMPMISENNAAGKLATWKSTHADEFKSLLGAKYVVIHCSAGILRSPEMVKAYAAAWKAAPKKNLPSQSRIQVWMGS